MVAEVWKHWQARHQKLKGLDLQRNRLDISRSHSTVVWPTDRRDYCSLRLEMRRRPQPRQSCRLHAGMSRGRILAALDKVWSLGTISRNLPELDLSFCIQHEDSHILDIPLCQRLEGPEQQSSCEVPSHLRSTHVARSGRHSLVGSWESCTSFKRRISHGRDLLYVS